MNINDDNEALSKYKSRLKAFNEIYSARTSRFKWNKY